VVTNGGTYIKSDHSFVYYSITYTSGHKEALGTI
jgi:hypothetical protein